MSVPMSLDAVAKAFAEELTLICGARLGGEASAAPSEVPSAPGWTLSVPVSGEVSGRLAVWVDRASATACARTVLALDETPGDDAVSGFLMDLVRDAGLALAARDGFADIRFEAPALDQGIAVAGSRAFYIAVPNTASCLLAVGVDSPMVTKASEDRLDAVLDVDLPLVVRFGRTVLPLGSIADLGPGSVIDMGRSPDEPVDLLVGERLIARGEVVVVGGHYGVRITELAAGREAGAALREAR